MLCLSRSDVENLHSEFCGDMKFGPKHSPPPKGPKRNLRKLVTWRKTVANKELQRHNKN